LLARERGGVAGPDGVVYKSDLVVLVQLEFVAMGLWWLIVAKGVGLVVVVLGSLQ
jgi:hypothetical protein